MLRRLRSNGGGRKPRARQPRLRLWGSGSRSWATATPSQGNRVGTNADGTGAIPSGLGINIEGGDENTIGGLTAERRQPHLRQRIRGHPARRRGRQPEEEVGPAEGNHVLGNLIGTDDPVRAARQRQRLRLRGMLILGSNDNTIGGHEPSAGNVIAANTGHGVYLCGVTATSCSATRSAPTWPGRSASATASNGIRIDSGVTTRSARKMARP